MKYNCYQDCSVIHGWFVYCAFSWQMHRLSKSLEIRLRMASFSKMSLLTCPCLRRKRRESCAIKAKNLTEIDAVWVQRSQKAGFLSPISYKITLTKEKKKKKKGKKRQRGGRKKEKRKSNGYTPSFYIGYFKDSFWPKKKINGWTKEKTVHLAITLSKIRLEDYMEWAALMPDGLKRRLPLQNGTL